MTSVGFMEKIHKFSISHGNFIGKPFPVPGKDDHVVFSYLQLNTSLVIVDLDLSSNRCSVLKEWPMHRIPIDSSLFSFVYKNCFYLVGKSFGTKLNLDNYKLSKNISHSKLKKMNLRECYTVETNDNVRIITKYKIYEYYPETDICSQVLGNFGAVLSPLSPQVLFLPVTHELFIFGGLRTRKIYKQFENESTVWHCIQDVEMPMDRWQNHGSQCIAAFDNVVLGFCFSDDNSISIWCLAMNSMEWSKSRVQIPAKCVNYLRYGQASLFKYGQSIYILKGGQGYLFRINVHDILSKNVIKSHRHHFAPLIKAYVGYSERNLNIALVPLPLQYLIIHFYPF